MVQYYKEKVRKRQTHAAIQCLNELLSVYLMDNVSSKKQSDFQLCLHCVKCQFLCLTGEGFRSITAM